MTWDGKTMPETAAVYVQLEDSPVRNLVGRFSLEGLTKGVLEEITEQSRREGEPEEAVARVSVNLPGLLRRAADEIEAQYWRTKGQPDLAEEVSAL